LNGFCFPLLLVSAGAGLFLVRSIGHLLAKASNPCFLLLLVSADSGLFVVRSIGYLLAKASNP